VSLLVFFRVAARCVGRCELSVAPLTGQVQAGRLGARTGCWSVAGWAVSRRLQPFFGGSGDLKPYRDREVMGARARARVLVEGSRTRGPASIESGHNDAIF